MRVLFLTHRLPYAPNRGDRIRAYHMIRALSACAEVTVLSLVHDADELTHAPDVLSIASHVEVARISRVASYGRAIPALVTSRPLTLSLLHTSAMSPVLERVMERTPPDVVIAYCSGMVQYAMQPPLTRVPFVLDMVDLDSLKWAALGRTAAWPLRLVYRREARCLARFEATAVRAARRTLAVNQREGDAICRLVPDARVTVVENGIDVRGFAPQTSPSDRPRVVFCGVLNYQPNTEAACRLARDIWPRVLAARPDAQLVLVGAHPTNEIRRLPLADSSISVTGAVPDVRPFLWDSAVSAVPLLTARGLQNKVLEALAAGLPTVVSPVVAEGLPKGVHSGCETASSDEDFARVILEWLSWPPATRRQKAGQARLESLTWDAQLRSLCEIVHDAKQA